MRTRTVRIGVIGAGLLGAAVARELVRRGAEVTVFEAARPGAGTSASTFAWVNSNAKEPVAYHELNVAGMAEHAQLARGGGDWFVPSGNLECARDPEHEAALFGRVERLRGLGYAARLVSRAEARALEPDLRVAGTCAFFPMEGFCFPALLLARLLGDAVDSGAEVRVGTRVRAVDQSASGVRVETTEGCWDGDAVAICAGRGSRALVDVPILDDVSPGSPVPGYLATTAPLPLRVRRVVTTAGLNLRPDGGGRLLLQALDLDEMPPDGGVPAATPSLADPAPGGPGLASPSLPDLFARRLAERYPAAGGAVVVDVVRALRVLPADGLPVVGFVAPGQYVVATHSGVTLAPLLGRLAATELVGGDAPELAPFRPDRFPASQPTEVAAARRPGEQ